MGGGGIRINLPEYLYPEQLVNLELQLPLTPPRQVQAVAQVIHVLKPRTQKGGGALFPAGMQFILLDERDRDLVFRQISATQIEHLRRMADRRASAESQPEAVQAPGWRRVAVKALWTLVFLVLAVLLVRFLVHYRETGPPNQIEKTYEKSIRKYRHLE